MKSHRHSYIPVLLACLQHLELAFIPYADSADVPVFSDDIEGYRGPGDLQNAYLSWQDGAHINVAVEQNAVGAGRQAMRVEVLAPYPQSGATTGSIYHALTLGCRNWSRATGMRFWVRNVSDETLLLLVNFKERCNEYWAVAPTGVFFMERPAGTFLRSDIQYCNLPIPSDYSGFVVVPFSSFSVPHWNTARGDEIMDLSGSDYQLFSRNFESWDAENRPLFVLLTIVIVLVARTVLSSIQKRIK